MSSSLPAEEDIISSLPDSVLSHILSFLPTKLAVSTSILSKRWTTLWLSVPTLDVNEENFKSFKSFASFRPFVCSVSRHPKLSLESLRIRFGKSRWFDPCDLNQLVLVAVQRRLQNFDLELNTCRYYSHEKLAPSILQVLSCKTLVVLKLKNLCVYDVPHLVHLPLLKSLHLKYIHFMEECVGECVHLMRLLNGCPILEDLHIRSLDHMDSDCDDSKEEFKGLPSLVRANISSSEPVFPFVWLYNAEFMRVTIGQFEQDLHIRSLDHMDSDCDVSKEEFKGFPSLVRANIDGSEPVFPFVWLYNVEFMRVTICQFEQMSINKYRVPTFHNLTHMELIFFFEWHEMWVIHVLQHCPKLQNLIFHQVDDEVGIEVEWKETETVPECLSSQLRTCSLKGFTGNQRDLHFAEYIMLNSKILRTMTVESNLVDKKAKHQILKKLYSYPRGSVTCKLFFD